MTAERAPEALQGLEWVVMGGADVLGTAAVQNPPFGPGRVCPQPLPGSGPVCRLSANKGEIPPHFQ